MTETFRFMARRISETPDEVLMFSFSLLSLVGIVLVAYWFHNRRKLHQLSHQIPASVVKNYLDSIIQNSSALKSSLFRGGGLELGEGIPSVMPLGDLPRGNVSLSSGGASSEEINQKLAEIATLTKRLSDKEMMIRQLEAKLAELSEGVPASGATEDRSEEIEILKSEVKRLQSELARAQQSKAPAAGGNAELEAELSSVTKERDELKERLMEYEIIEEDLANLKRLQQENEQLKNQLAGMGAAPATKAEQPKAAAPPAPEPEPEPEPVPEPPAAQDDDEDLEAAMAAAITQSEKPATAPAPAAETPVEEDEEDLEAAMAAAITEAPPAAAAPEKKAEEKPKSASDQKSAEELLSEFEKMLG